MINPDREQLKHACSDALRTLGPPYRFHGELMHGALRDGQDNAITWNLIHVLEELEKET
jgi:hypothetical protein